jgi:hypothetical protein
VVGLLGLALAASCRGQDGESWARKHLGDRAAEAMRQEASTVTGLGLSGDAPRDPSWAPKETTPYLPRPFVVLSTVYKPQTDSESLVFDELNLKLQQPVQTTGDVKGIAVLGKRLVVTRSRKKMLGHAEYAVYLVDRSAGTATVADMASTDAMEAFLASVPAEQP